MELTLSDSASYASISYKPTLNIVIFTCPQEAGEYNYFDRRWMQCKDKGCFLSFTFATKRRKMIVIF